MYKIFMLALCISVIVCCGSGLAAVTSNSTTWENQYTCNVMPDVNGWSPNGNIAFYTSLMGNGVVNLDTTGTDSYGWWSKTVLFNFDQGATVEIRAQIYSSAPGACEIFSYDSLRRFVGLEFHVDKIQYLYFMPDGSIGKVDANMTTTDTLHTYRVAILSGANLLKVWVDSNPTPVISSSLGNSGNMLNTIYFGDLTGTPGSDANWDIAYVRSTAHGAFPPVGATGYCGDGNHPRPVGDFNQDCVVNFVDLKYVALNWLADNRPK